MAKGNPFMGTIKGRIGDSVLYVSKGEQNIIKYQKNVTNPRSNGQMYQRARFSNAGRFFTRGRKAFFKFAFENKKGSQSDFNAFMKANINRSVLISKSALQIEGYPAIGKFIMCQGSLSAVSNRIVNDYWQAAFGIPAQSPNPTTIGELSQLLINTNTYEQGDILTFVFLNTSSTGVLPAVKPQGDYSTDWTIKQFRISVGDTTPLANYEMRAVSRTWGDKALMTLTDLADSQILTSAYGGFVCVHSRVVGGSLKVSTQELAVGESMQDAIDVAMGDDYIAHVIEDWKSTDVVQVAPDAVLKGAITWQPSRIKEIELVANPSSNWELKSGYFKLKGSIEEDTGYRIGYMRGENLSADDFYTIEVAGSSDSEITLNEVTEGEFAGCIAIDMAAGSFENGRYSWRVMLNQGGFGTPVAAIDAHYGVDYDDFVLVAPTPAEEYFPVSVTNNVATLTQVIAPEWEIATLYLYVPVGVTEDQLSVRHVSGTAQDDFVAVINQEDFMCVVIQGGQTDIGRSGANVFEVLYKDVVVATINFTCSGVPLGNAKVLDYDYWDQETDQPAVKPGGTLNMSGMPMVFTSTELLGGSPSDQGLVEFKRLNGFDINKISYEKVRTIPSDLESRWSVVHDQQGEIYQPMVSTDTGNITAVEFIAKYDGVPFLRYTQTYSSGN